MLGILIFELTKNYLQILKENEDLIVRLKHFEKSNGQLLHTLCSLRMREAKLTSQLQAATEVPGKEIHSAIHTKGVGVHVSLQVNSEDMQNSLKPCETCRIMSDKLETMSMQLRDAEATITTLQQQLNVAAEELELLRGENKMKPEECSRVTSELNAKEMDIDALEVLFEDLKNEVASKESKAIQDKENIRNLEEAVERLENHNCKLMTQLEDNNTVMMKYSKEHKVRFYCISKIFFYCIISIKNRHLGRAVDAYFISHNTLYANRPAERGRAGKSHPQGPGSVKGPRPKLLFISNPT